MGVTWGQLANMMAETCTDNTGKQLYNTPVSYVVPDNNCGNFH